MSLFNKFFTKRVKGKEENKEELPEIEIKPSGKHVFTELDRINSAELRRKQSEMKRIRLDIELETERIGLLRARADLDLARKEIKKDQGLDDDEESGDTMDRIMDTVLNVVETKMEQNKNSVNPVIESNDVEFTDEELQNIKETIPSTILNQLNALDDVTLFKTGKSYLPKASDNSILRLIELLKL